MKSKILCIIFILVLCTSAYSAENYSAALENMHNNFQSAYHSEWNASDLSLKLFNTVDRVFSQNIKSLQYGTVSFQLAMNRNSIIEKIQRDIFNAFRPEYERFLGKFQETFYRQTAQNISEVVNSKKALEIVNQISYAMHNSPRFVLELVFSLDRFPIALIASNHLQRRRFVCNDQGKWRTSGCQGWTSS